MLQPFQLFSKVECAPFQDLKIKVWLRHINITKVVQMLSASTPKSIFEVWLHHSVTTQAVPIQNAPFEGRIPRPIASRKLP